jgi:hypothetical protein
MVRARLSNISLTMSGGNGRAEAKRLRWIKRSPMPHAHQVRRRCCYVLARTRPIGGSFLRRR